MSELAQVDRRDGRRDRRDDDRHLRPRALPFGRRTRFGQDFARELVGRDHVPGFKRIQFTPDLMPSDITGTELLQEDPETHERRFKFQKGPVFTNLCSPTKSTVRHPKRRRLFWKRCRKRGFHRVERISSWTNPFSFWPLRTRSSRRNLPLARSSTRPLPV